MWKSSKKIGVACFFFIQSLYGDWNEEFDGQSAAFRKTFPQVNTQEYRKGLEGFHSLRSLLLKEGALHKLFGEMPPSQRLNILRPREGVVIKRRQWDRIQEFYVWEASLLLGQRSCVLPAYPVSIGGKTLILQKMESFVAGKGKEELPQEQDIRKVLLSDYWLAHLQAYILGIRDLLGRNIGISPEGDIRFFDAEYCFSYGNGAEKGDGIVDVGFIAESFDWPQYRQPLDQNTLEALQDFLQQLEGLETKLATYQDIRGLTVFGQNTYERIAIVRAFAFEEGTTFRDFVGGLYPSLDLGLEELNDIVGRIYGREVDNGAALLYVAQHIRHRKTAPEQQLEIADWIERYLP